MAVKKAISHLNNGGPTRLYEPRKKATHDIEMDPVTSGEDSLYAKVDKRDKTTIPEDSKFREESNKQRKLLKLYFYPAFRWKGNTCSFHLVYFLILLVQIVKVSLVTGQMFNFGYERANFSQLVNRGHTTLRHLLLENWTAYREVPPYPPTSGEFAVYRIDDLESGINFAVSNYYNIHHNAAGYFTRTNGDNMNLTIKYFHIPEDGMHEVTQDLDIIERTISPYEGLTTRKTNQQTAYAYDVTKHLQQQNLEHSINSMLSTKLYFTLHSVRVYEKIHRARCLNVQGWVTFSDLDNNGQVVVNLETLTSRIQCRDIKLNISDWSFANTSQAMGSAVIVFSLLSILFTVLSIAFMCFVYWKTKVYMRQYYKVYYKPMNEDEVDLPTSEYFRFLKFWDIIVIVSDILTLYGTVWIVNNTEQDRWIVEILDAYTVWLSFGGVLAWLSLFRFFKFHNKFSLLFSTLYRAFGDVLAYLLCVAVLFISFWICGYVVLNPYHVKFSTPSVAAETLLSVVNGDEIFATLAMLENTKTGGEWVWWFSRFYIMSYVAIFTVIIINLLIAIYMTAYEAVREYYESTPDERTLGPMEKALRGYLNERHDQNNVRQSIYHVLNDKTAHSVRTMSLKREFGKLARLDDSKEDIVLLKARTLRTFMEDEHAEETGRVIELGFMTFSFVTLPRRQ